MASNQMNKSSSSNASTASSNQTQSRIKNFGKVSFEIEEKFLIEFANVFNAIIGATYL